MLSHFEKYQGIYHTNQEIALAYTLLATHNSGL